MDEPVHTMKTTVHTLKASTNDMFLKLTLKRAVSTHVITITFHAYLSLLSLFMHTSLLHQSKKYKLLIMKKMFFIAAASMLAFTSCTKEAEKKAEKVFKGPVQNFQHGKSWTIFEINDAGNPLKLSVVIDSAAMNSLDNGAGTGGHSHDNSLSLKFHPKAEAGTPFTHALIDWNPHGHEPEPIYGKPHFDFHFYVSSEAERLAIPTYDQDSAKFKNYPAPAYLPANYVPIPGGVPQMGSHWVDVTSPELSGAPFTQTFIYGTYNGKVNFYEPMITEAFIRQNATFERAIPQPAKVQKTGWYPTKMRMTKANGQTFITLEDFVQRTAN